MKSKKALFKTLRILLILCFFIFTLTSCGNDEESNYVGTKTIDDVEVDCYKIHTTKQQEYLNDTYDMIGNYAKGSEELSKPYAVKLTWEESLNDTSWIVYIYEDALKTNCVYSTKVSSKEVTVYNLKIHTIYYWSVSNTKMTDILVYDGKPFYIDEDCIRNLNIEGVTNVRDVGGWKISDTEYVKQGLLYRSSKFNDDESTKLLITNNGIDVMVNTLNIKTEIDLRKVSDNENGGITSSPLGSNVEYISYPMDSNGNVMLLNKNKLAGLFEILGDESKYPIVFHCSIGTDRTGFVAFLINGLLGIQEEDLQRDYLFSNFGEIGNPRTITTIKKNYIDNLEMYAGKNLSEKIRSFLLANKVNESDIDNVINIMKGTK